MSSASFHLTQEEIEERMNRIRACAEVGIELTYPHPLLNGAATFERGSPVYNHVRDPIINQQGNGWLNPYLKYEELGVIESVSPNFLKSKPHKIKEEEEQEESSIKTSKKEKKRTKFKAKTVILSNALPLMK